MRVKDYVFNVDSAEFSMIIFGLRNAKDISNNLFKCSGKIPDKTYSDLIEKLSNQYIKQGE